MKKFKELTEHGYNKIKALQLKKEHPIEGGMKEDLPKETWIKGYNKWKEERCPHN